MAEAKEVIFEEAKWSRSDVVHVGSRIARFCTQGLDFEGIDDWEDQMDDLFYRSWLRFGDLFLLPRLKPFVIGADADGVSLRFVGPRYIPTQDGKQDVFIQMGPSIVLAEQYDDFDGIRLSALRPSTRTVVSRVAKNIAQEASDVYKLTDRVVDSFPELVFALEFPKSIYASGIRYSSAFIFDCLKTGGGARGRGG